MEEGEIQDHHATRKMEVAEEALLSNADLWLDGAIFHHTPVANGHTGKQKMGHTKITNGHTGKQRGGHTKSPTVTLGNW